MLLFLHVLAVLHFFIMANFRWSFIDNLNSTSFRIMELTINLKIFSLLVDVNLLDLFFGSHVVGSL